MSVGLCSKQYLVKSFSTPCCAVKIGIQWYIYTLVLEFGIDIYIGIQCAVAVYQAINPEICSMSCLVRQGCIITINDMIVGTSVKSENLFDHLTYKQLGLKL